jgi:hypothetical protein
MTTKDDRRIDTPQTARDKYREAMARNPRFKEAPKSGRGFVIIGAARPVENSGDRD